MSADQSTLTGETMDTLYPPPGAPTSASSYTEEMKLRSGGLNSCNPTECYDFSRIETFLPSDSRAAEPPSPVDDMNSLLKPLEERQESDDCESDSEDLDCSQMKEVPLKQSRQPDIGEVDKMESKPVATRLWTERTREIFPANPGVSALSEEGGNQVVPRNIEELLQCSYNALWGQRNWTDFAKCYFRLEWAQQVWNRVIASDCAKGPAYWEKVHHVTVPDGLEQEYCKELRRMLPALLGKEGQEH